MRFDLIYEQLLTELFNTKQETEWFYNYGEYQTILPGPNEASYLLNLTPYWNIELPGEAFNVKQMTPEQWRILKVNSWHVEFGDDESSDQVGITGEQGSSSPKVFGLIGNALLAQVKKHPRVFQNLVFSAKEPSRQSLYKRLAPLLAKKLNKDVVVSDNGEWFFILSKN